MLKIFKDLICRLYHKEYHKNHLIYPIYLGYIKPIHCYCTKCEREWVER